MSPEARAAAAATPRPGRRQSATFVTACPRNCYSTCGLRVTVEDGRLRRIEPLLENAATAGGACLKGLSYLERVYSPDRLLYPLRKDPHSGSFRRVAWDETLDEIARRLASARDRHGPQTVLFYAGSGTKGLLNGVSLDFWRLFGGCTTTYGDLCWPAGLEATRLTLGANEHNAPWDLVNAKVIVLWGKNAAETNIHQMPFIERALEQGARLVVIDPRRTETAERASLLIQPRPGTDGALALAVAHVLFARSWIDEDFTRAHVLGVEAYRQRVATCTPAWAAAIASVPEGQILQLAEWIGTTRPVTICAGFGMQRFTNSGQTMRAMIALLALTGNIGLPGAGWMFANLRTQIFGALKDPLDFYPPGRPDGVVRVSVSTTRLGRDVLAAADPPITVAWVERGNPIPQNPETPTVIRAFRSLDFRVVVDEFLTDTAREADIVLPAKTLFEQTDVIGAYWHDYLQIRQKVIEPPGEVRPETEIYRQLALRLGVPADRVAQVIPGPSDAAVEEYLERRLARFPGLSLDRLREGPVRAPGAVDVAFADLRFPTPSGRIEIESAEAATRWGVDVLPAYAEPAESTRRPPTHGGRYPLHLLTPNTKNRIHSQFGNLPSIRALDPRPVLYMHPADARARGVRPGTEVRVFNDRGTLVVSAGIDHGLSPGCVCLHNGWWMSDGGAVNLLSEARETDMGFGAAFHENLVEVEPR